MRKSSILCEGAVGNPQSQRGVGRSGLMRPIILFVMMLLAACGGGVDSPNESPVAHISAGETMGEAPFELHVDGTLSYDNDGRVVAYHWDFGDDTSKAGAVQTHIFHEAGSYTVSLTVEDDRGAFGVETLDVVVAPPQNQSPTADIASDTTRGAAPLDVEFSGLNSADPQGEIIAYHWDFGDGHRASGAVLDHRFHEPGEYEVVLTVDNSSGVSATATEQITVLSANATFSISGTITSLPYTDTDGTLNDPAADYFNNSGHTTNHVQPLGNPVLLNGFVTAAPTGRINDVYRFDANVADYYQVDLEEGQFVSLQIVNYVAADLDLALLEADSLEFVASSFGVGEFESVQAPEAGRYYVAVHAHEGTSKYLLNVGRSSFVSGSEAAGHGIDFELDQAIVTFKEQGALVGQSSVHRAQMQLSHQQEGRAALVHLNPLNPQTRSVLRMNMESDFERFVAEHNPRSAEKIATLRAIKTLRQQGDVASAEPNYRLQNLLTPSDPGYRYQWHYPVINLPQAWDITVGDPSVVVAVIDTGVFLDHPDLQGQLTDDGFNFISSSEISGGGDGIGPSPDDPGNSARIGSSAWHGTHVAGIIGAAMNNNEGGTGVAPSSRVMPLRALGESGGTAYDVLQSVRYAAGFENDSGLLPQKRADIINLSLGGSGFSQFAQSLYRQVHDAGIFVVAAAGNSNSGEPMYPASYDGVISVSATDFDGNRAPYSNRGPYVDVAAPGGNLAADANNDGYSDGVLSSVATIEQGQRVGNYALYQGTSMAAPHVAGVLALMKAVYPELTPDEFSSLLASGAITSVEEGTGRDDLFGYGLIDAYLAVSAAQALAEGGTTAAVVASPSTLSFDDMTSRAELTLRAVGSGEISVANVTASDSWLEIVPVDTGPAGMGRYQINIDRTNLPNGNYRGTLEFTTHQRSPLQVRVDMRVGELEKVGNAGFLYVLLVDAETDDPVAMHAQSANDGQYSYSFQNIPIGRYYLAAGSDIDNDGYICDDGESCGFYPSPSELQIIQLNRNLDGVDFQAGLSTTLNAASVTFRRVGIERSTQAIPDKQLPDRKVVPN